MIDRGIIKWQPFNSCFDSKIVIKDIAEKKNIIKFPTLSEDQLYILEKNITDAYNLKLPISIDYFYDEHLKNITGKISFLDNQNKKIYINQQEIYFKQILKIKEL